MKHIAYILLLCVAFCQQAYSQTRLYVRGSAVPGGIQELEKFSRNGTGNNFKFHGRLVPGKLYICTATSASARLYKPRQLEANIIGPKIAYTSAAASDSLNCGWTVSVESDNYRFTVTPSSTSAGTVTGEIFARWYEAWIVGGCVQDVQDANDHSWELTAGRKMEQSWWDPHVFTWIGLLKNYTWNEQPKRLKIIGQYGWGPKSVHPFKQDEQLASASQLWYSYGDVTWGSADDNKWSIGKDGYYSIELDVFRETIHAEYLGEEEPDVTAIGSTADDKLSVRTRGLQMEVTSSNVLTVQLYDLGGNLVQAETGSMLTITAPKHGVYILRTSEGKARKVRL